ncbi:MAG: type I secretion system permease/ATPase, partial [Rivularia sp. (in: cyanobacteria)]
MASRENSNADSQTTSKINLSDNKSHQAKVLSSVNWNQPPLCWLTAEQQTLLQNQSSIVNFRLGEKIWYQESVGYQFLIVSGKVRLRSEGIGKPLATLKTGDWFGDLNYYPTECKAVAASKEVLVLRTNSALWADLSTPQIEQFWQGDKETRRKSNKVEISPPSPPPSPHL